MVDNEEDSAEEEEGSDAEAMSEMDEAEDGDEWGGVEGGSTTAPLPEGQQQPHKSKKVPMGEELRDIKDASELFKSSSFKLQVPNSSLGSRNLVKFILVID